MHRCLALVALVALVALASLPAQNPPLTPTSNLVLDTTATQGHFAFSFIDIPVGVRVNFTGAYPVQIRCDGDAVIRGQLDVDASGTTGGPGSVATGTGSPGNLGIGCSWPSTFPGSGTHAGLYGSSLPFSLAGGSPGGSFQFWSPSSPHSPVCVAGSPFSGGGGGGTLVLEAGGMLDIFGRVSANGASNLSIGSGGSLLLRGFAGLTVHVAGLVQATAEQNAANVYPAGIIRLDAYGQVPSVAGTVDPPPRALALPYLEETQPPVIGNSWQLRVAAPRGNGVTLAASFLPGSTTNQFGTVGIDLSTAIVFTFLPMPSTGHDPLTSYQLAIANVPSLVGLHLYVAGLDWLTTLPPRYTNTIQTMVQ